MIENNPGIVYLLTNPAMPGFVKIGSTMNESVTIRMTQLYTTGVPFPFECAYAARVTNVAAVEKALHTAFGPNRVNVKREFFDIEAAQAIAIIKLLQIEDVTPTINREAEKIDHADREAGEAYAKKRPRFNFREMGIPIGAELVSVNNQEIAIVQSERSVLFRGEETSLTNATKRILENEYAVAPGPYWMYDGRRLRDIYNETYQRVE